MNETAANTDMYVRFTVRDTAGAVIDLTGAVGIVIGIYQSVGSIIKKYSKVVATGYDTIEIIDAVNGLVEIYIPRSVTRSLISGDLMAELKINEEDVDAEDGFFHTGSQGVFITKIKASVLRDVQVP